MVATGKIQISELLKAISTGDNPLSALQLLVDESEVAGHPPDVALLNLVCALDLPGAGVLHVDRYLEWLDDVAQRVEFETKRHYHKFLSSPGVYENSQARFCMVCLVSVLQSTFGVRYHPKWQGLSPDVPVPKNFGVDARDLFIHAIMDGVGGTCGSLPVLYAAVGRRLGYPLRLVKAARHLFVRWDDPEGIHWHHRERFNVEATGPGVHFLPDDHYRTWPRPITEEDIEAGIFLRSLSPREELAEFIATRGYCLQANGRLLEAVDTLAEALKLVPHNRHLGASYKALRLHIVMRQRGHAFLNAPNPSFSQESVGPFWMEGVGGSRTLVQIVSPVAQPLGPQPRLGISLVRQSLLTPNGMHVDAWLPMSSPANSLIACWARLSDGRWALIHKEEKDSWSRPSPTTRRLNHQPYGRPIVPLPDRQGRMPWPDSHRSDEPSAISGYEQHYLTCQIQQHLEHMRVPSDSAGFLPAPLAMPAGPAIPRLQQSGIGIPHIL